MCTLRCRICCQIFCLIPMPVLLSLLLSLLTLTSFPFRVLHVNGAFSQAYGSSRVVGETFFDVFSREGRQHSNMQHFAPSVVSCPTLLGAYQNEVVRLLIPSCDGTQQVEVSCTIKVHPVWCQPTAGRRSTDEDQPELSYYAVTVKSLSLPKADMIVTTNDGDLETPIPDSIACFSRMLSTSSSISIKRRGPEGNFCALDECSSDELHQSSSNTLFYLS
jgi:hypothetical protein